MSMTDYDVIIAFDPDWWKLSVKQRELLNRWVDQYGGGLIFVAGPTHSYQLARPAGEDFSKLLPLIPVVLKDIRLHGIGLGAGLGHDPTRPYALNFTRNAKAFPFLKLDEAGESPIAGWNAFFWNKENYEPEPGKDVKPRRGFYSYYPVERLKPASEVIATFAGPKDSRIGDNTDAFKDQQPFIVTMPYGLGRTMYLGSGEFWRLRAFKDGIHERLWIKMAQYVAANPRAEKKFGRITLLGRDGNGRVHLEAHLKGADLEPADIKLRPTVQVKRLAKPNQPNANKATFKFDLTPKPVDPFDSKWEGNFAGFTDEITEPGEYEFTVAIPNVEGASVRQTLSIPKSDPELEDVRVDFGQLHELASRADPLLNKLKADPREDIEAAIRLSVDFPVAPVAKGSRRLFFRLEHAGAVPQGLEKRPAKKFPKVDPPKLDEPFKSVFMDKKTVKLLVIDGAGAASRIEKGDSYFLQSALESIPGKPYAVIFGDEFVPGNMANALDRVDLSKFGAVFLLNVPQLSASQIANLEKFSKAGGGVAFFMGPKVNSKFYNQFLFKEGKGIFPVPLSRTKEPEAADQLLLRDDLFPERERYPIFGEIFDRIAMREVLKNLPIARYYKVPRRALAAGSGPIVRACDAAQSQAEHGFRRDRHLDHARPGPEKDSRRENLPRPRSRIESTRSDRRRKSLARRKT